MSATRLAPARERVLPAAVSPLTARLLAGPARHGVVAGAHRHGVYVAVAGTVLPVLARDAVALPTALRLAVCSTDLDWGVAAGDAVVVGGGTVRMGATTVRGARTWRPARVRGRRPDGAGPSCPGARAARRDVVRRLREAADEGSGWLLAPVRAALTAPDPTLPVADLVGRGRGLTPGGDDALAGALLVERALGSDREGLLAAAVRRRLAATTAVSAALLDAAADGWAAPEAVALVDAAAAGHLRATDAHLPAVLAIGHDSGRDLVAGVAATLGARAATPTGRTAA